MKLRIKDETIKEFSVKASNERKKLDRKLISQVKEGKITNEERNGKLAEHGEIWENKIQNEIAKRIGRAHLYSFNLSNYISNLPKNKMMEWNHVLSPIKRVDGKTIDDCYTDLCNAPPERADRVLALMDVRHSLEFDIVKNYLMGFEDQDIAKYDNLSTLRAIIESDAKYPRVRLGDYLKLSKDRVKPFNNPETRFRILGVSNTKGIFLNETKLGSEIKQVYYRVKPKEFCYNPYRVNVGSIGLNGFDYENQLISGAYVVFGTDETNLLPEFLLALFKSKQFNTYVSEKANGGVRMNFKFEYLKDWEIPLPSISDQQRIVQEMRRLNEFKSAAIKVIDNWQIDETEYIRQTLIPKCKLQGGM